MGLTTNHNDPGLREIYEDGPFKGQQKVYQVLSEEERAKGFVRPVRNKYIHLACGVVTRMGDALSETYARNPKFYGGTFCVGCGTHFRLINPDGLPAFIWDRDGEPVGSTAEEAAKWNAEKQQREAEKQSGAGI